MRDRSTVRERHLDGLPLAHVKDRPRRTVAVERPGRVPHAGRDLDDHVLQGHVDLHQVARWHGRQCRVVGGMRLREALRVRARLAREALERKRLAGRRVVSRMVVGRGRDRAARVDVVARLVRGLGRDDGGDDERADREREEQNGDRSERADAPSCRAGREAGQGWTPCECSCDPPRSQVIPHRPRPYGAPSPPPSADATDDVRVYRTVAPDGLR